MSEVKVNKISPRTNCGTVQLGDSGDTITIPAGATIVNNGTQTGFGRTGTVDWDTTAKTAGFTAVSGNGYFVNTTSGAVTVTLPATPSAGDIVSVSDYANTSVTNNITVARNGSNIEGNASDFTIENNGIAMIFVYVDGTRGWKVTGAGKEADKSGVTYMTATGGTITCCGDYKIHTFTGPGTFTVCTVGDLGTVDYLVVAGGAGGGSSFGDGSGGGGGAGGFRESSGTASGCYTASPLGACVSALPVSAQAYPITVGSGGAGGTSPGTDGSDGSNSVFSTITSTGGGGGGEGNDDNPGRAGGSGGGVGNCSGTSAPTGTATAGAGNTPPVSPSQGFPGGGVCAPALNGDLGAGGGGATAVGQCASCSVDGIGGGNGGAGATTSISGSSTAYAGGGGGGSNQSAYPIGAGGTGGGGNGALNIPAINAVAGTANTGGGGGGGSGYQVSCGPTSSGAAGGSGIVIIRYKYQ